MKRGDNALWVKDIGRGRDERGRRERVNEKRRG